MSHPQGKNPRIHPPESHWLDYANGEADASLRALLEAHLAQCDACGAVLGNLAEPGGALLRALVPAAPSDALFGRILARLPQPVGSASYPIPATVRELLPSQPEKAWRGVLKSGVRFLELAAAEAQGVKLYLVHLRAGAAFPHHAHGGLEEAVILAGGTVDGAEVLEAGDWRVYPPGTDHQPKALPDEDCWLLVRLEEGLQLSGWRGLLQKL